MRFYNRYAQARYTPLADTYRHWGPNQKEKVPGLHVQFRNHVFDTEHAQVENNWTDEQRELVEKHLTSHLDFGSIMRYLDADPVAAQTVDPVAEPLEMCLHMTMDPAEGPQVCGQPIDTKRDDGLCERHGAMIDAAAARHPNRTDQMTEA
jgi:hypothetical protein